MPLLQGSEEGRRLLIAAGTGHFEKLAELDLLHVPEELERIVTSFAALGYERQQSSLNIDPERDQLLTLLANTKKESRTGDVVVAYYTGHGATDPKEKDRFYLLAHNSDSSDLFGTALAAEDLARALLIDSKASQVLVILDAC